MDSNLSAVDNGFKIYKKPYTGWNMPIINILIRIAIVSVMSICCISIGMTTLNIAFDLKSVIYTGVIASVVCSVMYFNVIAAAVLFIGAFAYIFKYISDNSEMLKMGVLSFFNMGYDVVRNSLNLPEADGFNIVAGQDFSNEIHILTLIAVIILVVLLSFFIGRYMSVVFSAFITFSAISYSFFLENAKDYISIALILICFLLVFSLRLMGVGKLTLSKKLKNRKNSYRRLRFDGVLMTELTVSVLIFSFIISSVLSVAFSRDAFESDIEKMDINNYIKYTIRDVMVMKYAEYKKFVIPETVDYGQLGFYSCVNPEEKNMFNIKTDPISEDKLYLRNYIGADYTYRGNCWTSKDIISDINMTNITADALKNSNADSNTIELKKYGEKTFSNDIYVPYYASVEDSEIYNYIDDCNIKGADINEYSIDVYENADVSVDDTQYKDYVYNTYLSIDSENKEVIDKVLEEININKDSGNIEEKIKEYFKNNYTYEFDSGVVPYGKDFVNYFLTETKEGSFAQFASATVLMYRAMGIPARYVGGYALDKEQILAGKLSNGKKSVEVNSLNMYTWAEVYEDGFGWRYVDTAPTPAFSELAEEYGGKDNNDNIENDVAENHTSILDEYFKPIENEYYNPMHLGRNFVKLLISIVVLIILIILLTIFIKYTGAYILFMLKYNKSSDDKKAYMLMEKLRKKLKLNKNCDYSQFAEESLKGGMSKEKASELAALANKLIFSNKYNTDDLKKLKQLISSIK